jgi:hypothetical protein
MWICQTANNPASPINASHHLHELRKERRQAVRKQLNEVVSAKIGGRERMIVPPAASAGGYEVSDDVLRALFIEIFMAIYSRLSALVPMAVSPPRQYP